MNPRWNANITPAERLAGVLTRSGPGTNSTDPTRHGGHRWMMLACCVPMLIVAMVLVATGVAGAGALLAAIGCTLMMALMMRGMSHGGER